MQLPARRPASPRPPGPRGLSSDACTGSHDPITLNVVDKRGARDPAIFGHALGLCFRFPLEGKWRRVHITVTEELGLALCALLLAPLLPYAPLLVQTDATAALAFIMGRPKSTRLRRIYARWPSIPRVQAFIERVAAQHVKGIANVIDDAGSRSHWPILQAYAAACDVKLQFVEMDEEVESFMSDAPSDLPPSQPRRAQAPSSTTVRQDEVICHMPPHTTAAASGDAALDGPSPSLVSRSRRTKLTAEACARATSGGMPAPPTTAAPAAPTVSPSLVSRSKRARALAHPPPSPLKAAPRTTSVAATLLSPPLPPRPKAVPPAKPRPPSPRHGPRAGRSSLRPASAAAVRAMAARNTAARLQHDDSTYAICPGNPERLAGVIADVDDRNAEAREASTRRLDSWGYEWWVKACDALDTPPLRPTDSLDEECESYTASFALMYIAAHMKPRRRTDSAAKPAGAWSAYSHSRTVLEAYGCRLPSTAKVRRTLRGTLRTFVRNTLDDEVLVPRRKQPFSRAQELSLLSVLLHDQVEAWTPRLHRMLRWAVAFARCTGAR